MILALLSSSLYAIDAVLYQRDTPAQREINFKNLKKFFPPPTFNFSNERSRPIRLHLAFPTRFASHVSSASPLFPHY